MDEIDQWDAAARAADGPEPPVDVDEGPDGPPRWHLVDDAGEWLCPEVEMRDAMADDEFWEHVLIPARPPVDDYDPDDDDNRPTADELVLSTPCPVCGEVGPCAVDADGRPMTHLTPDDDEAPREPA